MSSKALLLSPSRKPRIALPMPSTRRAPIGGAEGQGHVSLHPALLLREVMARTQGGPGAGAGGGRLESYPARGALLRDSLLNPGDLIMVQPEQPVADGELALVQLEGQTAPLLRRIQPAGDCLRLIPEDQRYPVELRPVERVRVLGRVLSIVRQTRAAGQLPMAI